MNNQTMRLKIILPHKIFLDQNGIKRIVLETPKGSMGILPRRLDCVTPLSPGILVYEIDTGREEYLALDMGIMVKMGFEVFVAVRRAIKGNNLEGLRERVDNEFRQQDEQERQVRVALTRMQNEIVRRFLELKSYD